MAKSRTLGAGDNVSPSSSFTISESEGAFAPTRQYVFSESGALNVVEFYEGKRKSQEDFDVGSDGRNNWVSHGVFLRVKVALRQVFLPYGYPQSVSKDYVEYQCWDTVQAFASSITGALATEAVMKGVGVGESAATPLAAALTWLLKSGSGHIGQIVFAWAKGTSLDGNCKQWRLFADILNDCATLVDLLAPLAPQKAVVFVLCGASVARALVGVAGGATRAAVTVHQSRANNMGDVSAKDGSQETLVNLVALITSLILLPLVSGNPTAVWTLFILFTCVHLYANFRAVRSLQMETWNEQRLLLCLQEFLTSGRVGSVSEINNQESVFVGCGIKDVDICGRKVRMGIRLDDALKGHDEKRLRLTNAVRDSKGKPFLIFEDINQMSIVLHDGICGREALEAYVKAVMMANGVTSFKLEEKLDSFKNSCQAMGWEWERAALTVGDWRAKWVHKD